MTAKFSAQRRELFLQVLRETGNQTIAAEAAKVSSSWVQLRRSEDPAFRRSDCEDGNLTLHTARYPGCINCRTTCRRVSNCAGSQQEPRHPGGSSNFPPSRSG